MAALTITAANISLVSGDPLGNQIAAAAITVGQLVYLNDSGAWGLAQGDGTAVEAGQNDIGIALSGASAAGQRISVATGRGNCIVGFGAILTAGLIYTCGDTAGAIVPSADNGTTDKATIVGQAVSTSNMKLTYAYHAGAVLA